MRLSAAALKRRFAELRFLINEWDPVNLMELPAPHDEYECLVGPVLRRLEAGQTSEEIAAYLEHHIPEHFGVPCRESLPFARKVSAWYRERWLDLEHIPRPDPDPDPPRDKSR